MGWIGVGQGFLSPCTKQKEQPRSFYIYKLGDYALHQVEVTKLVPL